MIKGASFSDCKKHRYALWRIWDESLPKVMFIGLNPSTADASEDDPTIESVIRLARFNGYGGAYMTNCWSFISTDPKKLSDLDAKHANFETLLSVRKLCRDVVFAWGSFKIVKSRGRDAELIEMFPDAKCIVKTNGGSPGHPLFKKGTTKFINY